MDGLEVGRLHVHTHAPDPEKVKLVKLRSEMKTRAKQTMDNTRDIINNAVAGQVQEVLGLHYTVHGNKNGRNIIGVYAMLTNKHKDTHERMLRHVQFLSGNANPATINIDFERAVINACRTVFPLSLLSGCFFSFITKHLQESSRKPFK